MALFTALQDINDVKVQLFVFELLYAVMMATHQVCLFVFNCSTKSIEHCLLSL